VTGSTDLEFLDKAILHGARGVVQKAETPTALLKAIERVQQGEYWINRVAIGRIFLEIARQSAPRAPEPAREKIATLTARERKTISALTQDASAPGKILASRLCISEHTLRNHLTSIYQKLGLVNRLDLYAFAVRNGLGEKSEPVADPLRFVSNASAARHPSP
jgi:DNA-binding NarL/FixJ family response regulator